MSKPKEVSTETREYVELNYAWIRKDIKTFRYPSPELAGNPFEAEMGFIPEHMHESVCDYVLLGLPQGEFLRYLFSGKLFETLMHADYKNLTRIHVYAAFLHNNVPAVCYGSEEKYLAWVADASERMAARAAKSTVSAPDAPGPA